jgi:hypothetical protein
MRRFWRLWARLRANAWGTIRDLGYMFFNTTKALKLLQRFYIYGKKVFGYMFLIPMKALP